MLIQQKIGNLNSYAVKNKALDLVCLAWFETNKRILHKKTKSGLDISLKFLRENQQLTEGDILFEAESVIIAVEILPCEAIIVRPKTMEEMASACYEIGNKHAALFFCDNELQIPFENPLYYSLQLTGFDVTVGERKLLNRLQTTVAPHISIQNISKI
jgi:urease accessory protein